VVVDDVEDHPEPLSVGRADKLLQSMGPAVGRLGGRDVDPVVSPAVVAGKLRHRHQLDRGHAERGEVMEMGDDGSERPLRREGAHVQLIDHEVFKGASTGGFGVCELHDARWATQPVRLPARARVGQRSSAVEHEHVVVTGRGRDDSLVEPVVARLQRVLGRADSHGDRARPRSPDAEDRRAVGLWART
jgi:hypothetical protein